MSVKAIGLISGGLDSSLATKVMLDLGVEVEGVYCSTGFYIKEHVCRLGGDGVPHRINEALRLKGELNFNLHMVDVSDDYMPVVTRPKYGYGSNINPCVDCRIHMLKKVKMIMEELGAKFVFTGEVLGQRPMSQHREAMKNIEMDSGLAGLVLRPLTAKLLDPTIPETKGWVDRSRLLALTGRSRKPQLDLAKKLGLNDCPQPAGGGCYLTDASFAAKLRDIFDHNGRENLAFDDTELLKVGRHFRVSKNTKVIVGRNQEENEFLKKYEKGKHVFRIHNFPSAFVLAEIKNDPAPEELEVLASIAARYSDAKDQARVAVEHQYEDRTQWVEAGPIEDHRLQAWRI